MNKPDDIETWPVPLDRETRANLERLGRVLRLDPRKVIAPSILKDAVSAAAMELALPTPRLHS